MSGSLDELYSFCSESKFLLVIYMSNEQSPGPVIREVSHQLSSEVILATLYSALSAEEMIKFERVFQSLLLQSP